MVTTFSSQKASCELPDIQKEEDVALQTAKGKRKGKGNGTSSRHKIKDNKSEKNIVRGTK
jgi:hypothetical protein